MPALPPTRWATYHAAALTAATGLTLLTGHLSVVLAVGATSFAALLLGSWRAWTPRGRFGWANGLTAVRLVGLIALAAGYPALTAAGQPVALLGLGLLALDGVDGTLARRQGDASEFGEFFDKETDAFFLLVLCLLGVLHGLLPGWAVGLGLLRYGFVLVLPFARRRAPKETRSTWARFVYAGVMLALLVAFLPLPGLAEPLVLLTGLAMTYSFGQSFWWMFSTR